MDDDEVLDLSDELGYLHEEDEEAVVEISVGQFPHKTFNITYGELVPEKSEHVDIAIINNDRGEFSYF